MTRFYVEACVASETITERVRHLHAVMEEDLANHMALQGLLQQGHATMQVDLMEPITKGMIARHFDCTRVAERHFHVTVAAEARHEALAPA